MPQLASYDQVQVRRKQIDTPGGPAWNTPFFVPPEGIPGPHAFLAEGTRRIGTHYHDQEEFQIVVSGTGSLGKHNLAMHTVHYARAFTPYGPIVPGKEGLGFLTIRAIKSQGRAYHLPANRDNLLHVPDRDPFQSAEVPQFDASKEVFVHQLEHIKDKHGLAAYSISLKPGAKTKAPDPATSGCQFIVVIRGNLDYQGKTYNAITMISIRSEESAFQLVAGSQGVEALVLNFPRRKAASAK